jgi:adenine-specific DNA glycosylase
VAAVHELLLAWYTENGRDLPWRQTNDPYAILVSEVMAQQTQVDRVVPRWERWLERWPTAEALAAASAADVIREWQGLGYNRRALNLHRAAQHIAAHGWPDDLTELPGVGRYTADAVACFALGRDVLPIDVNVRRVQERTGHAFTAAAGQALMDLGATVCLAPHPTLRDLSARAGMPIPWQPLRAAAQAGAVRGLVPAAAGGHASARRRRRAAGRRPRSGRGRVARTGRARPRLRRHRLPTRLVP